MGQWSQRHLLAVGILNWQPQEVEDTLVLCTGGHMLGDFIPVITVHV